MNRPPPTFDLDSLADSAVFDSPREQVVDVAKRLNGLLNAISGLDAQRVIEHALAIHCSRMGSKADAITVANGVHKHTLQLIDDLWVGDFDSWKDGVEAWKLPRKRDGRLR